MKKIMFFAVAMLTMLAVACTEEVQESLEVTSSELAVEVGGTESPISFSANSSWTISSDEDWISFDRTEGEAGDITVVMTVDPNTEYEERTATVTISMGSKTTSIEVTQAGIAEFAIETPYNISAEAQTIDFTISSNVEYTYEISEDASWIKPVTETKAAPEESTLSFSVSENTSAIQREGRVYVEAGDNIFCLVVTQAGGQETMTTVEATYLANTMWIYDASTYEYPVFHEYLIRMSSDSGAEVSLAINVPEQDDYLSVIPSGEYTVDAAGTHAENTFSLKSLTRNERYYTTIVENGVETEVSDGVINIANENGTYTITATLYDTDGEVRSYIFSGNIDTIEDRSLGGQFSSVKWRDTYFTYYSTKANMWDVTLCISKAPSEGETYFRYFSFQLVGDAGDITGEEIPTGTFTWAEQTEIESDYANGIVNAQPQTFFATGGEDEDGNDADILEGSTITVTKNDDGTYDIVLDLTLRHYSRTFDEEYNEIITELGTVDYDATLVGVMAPDVDLTYYSGPTPDADTEFTDMGLGNRYITLYIGNKWNIDNCNTFILYQSGINGSYELYMCLNIEGDWTFEANLSGRFCSTPLPTGTFTYSDTPVANAIIPAVYSTNGTSAGYRNYIRNTYSGTLMPIKSGTVEITSTGLVFNLEAGPADNSATYHFTGNVACSMYYAQDQTATASYYYTLTEWNNRTQE